MKITRAAVVFATVLIPLAILPGTSSYSVPKWGLFVAAAAMLVACARYGSPGRTLSSVIAAAGASGCLVVMAGAPGAAYPALVWRGLGIVVAWFAFAGSAAAAFNEERHFHQLLEAATTSIAGVAAVGMLQVLGLLPSPVTSLYELPGVSTLGNQNYVAELCAIAFWPSMILAFQARGRRAWISRLRSLLLASTILVCQAAGAALTLMASACVVLAALAVCRTSHWRRVPVVIATALVLGAAGAGAVTIAYVRAVERLTEHSGATRMAARLFESNHGFERLTNWAVAVDQISRRPLAGVGLDNYQTEWIPSRARLTRAGGRGWLAEGVPRARHAHNDYLQWAAETGVIGILWLLATAAAMMATWRRRFLAESTHEGRQSRLFLAAAVVVVGMISLVSFPMRLPASLLLSAVLCGLALRNVDASDDGTRDTADRRSRQTLRFRRMPLIAAAVLVTALVGREIAADIHTVRGERAFMNALYEQARPMLARGCAWTLWPAERYYLVAVSELSAGRSTSARAMLEAAATRAPTFPPLLQLAELEMEAGEIRAAMQRVDVVIDCAPEIEHMSTAVLLAGRIELRRGRYREAEDHYMRAVGLEPEGYAAHMAMGHLEAIRGNVDAARSWYLGAAAAISRLELTSTSAHRAHQLAEHRRIALPALRSLADARP